VHISVISTYPPRLCGVGVYTADLVAHYSRHRPGDVMTVLGADAGTDSVASVRSASAAGEVDAQRPSVVLAQYAHGMYGDDAGSLVDVLRRVAAPTVLTLHHVGHPDDPRAAPLPDLVAAADAVVVLGREPHRRLVEEFGLGAADITVIPHGLDLVPPAPRPASRRAFGVAPDAVVLVTFGLLRPAKGLDRALQLVGAARKRVPGLVYLIAGAPHPGSSPEEFRRRLRADVAAAGLTDVVRLVDRYLETSELQQVLAAADLLLLPYRRLDQTTSGPLLRGLAAGTPFFATPFSHAVELAEDCAGIVDSCAPADRAAARMCRLLGDHALMASMRARASRLAAGHDWRRVADLHHRLFRRVVGVRKAGAAG
jgi:glycosyltransferase involved in cell wall biosynthesis